MSCNCPRWFYATFKCYSYQLLLTKDKQVHLQIYCSAVGMYFTGIYALTPEIPGTSWSWLWVLLQKDAHWEVNPGASVDATLLSCPPSFVVRLVPKITTNTTFLADILSSTPYLLAFLFFDTNLFSRPPLHW